MSHQNGACRFLVASSLNPLPSDSTEFTDATKALTNVNIAPAKRRQLWSNSHSDSSIPLNVSRAISLLNSYGYEAWPVSFDEAVEVRLGRPGSKPQKDGTFPRFKILVVRDGISKIRHFLDEQSHVISG